MVFSLPRDPLKPARRLQVGLRPGVQVVSGPDLAVLVAADQAVAAAARQGELIVSQSQAAYEAEKRRGYEDGLEQARMESAEQLMENVTRSVEFFGRVEARMVDLVMEAVQAVVSGFSDRERVLAAVRNVLTAARGQKQVTLRLAPDRVDMVRAELDAILAEFPGVAFLDLASDPRLSGDACLLESEVGVVEANLQSQLQALRQAFDRVLGSRSTA
jgi:type III secretion protein L